jgi:S-adenosylhomocysteine hydrolase
MNRVLITWVGRGDVVAAKKYNAETDAAVRKATAEKDPGPILRLLRRQDFDQVCLLDDMGAAEGVVAWICSQLPQYDGRIKVYPSPVRLRNQYRATYEFTRDQVKTVIDKDFKEARAYGLLVSPGTPAAQVAMILASQGLFETEVRLYNTFDPTDGGKVEVPPGTPDLEEVDLGFSLRVDLDLPALQQMWQKDYLEDRMPLLAYYTHEARKRAEKPFAGKRVLVVLHFLKNLLGFLEAARELGLDPTLTTVFAKSYPYPSKRYVTEQLRKAGFEVRSTAEIDARANEFLQAHADKPLLVIEDGGFFSPRLLQDPGLRGQVVGVVEQTTRGYNKAKDALKLLKEKEEQPPFPILPLTPSKLKAGFEPPHIGDAAVRAVQNMLSACTLRTRKAAVLGCGTIGTALICALTSHGVPVTYYDKDACARVNALNLCGLPAPSIKDAVADADLIFGTTGKTAIDREVIELVPADAWLISVSSERVEIDLDYLRENNRSSEPLYSGQFSERSDFNVPIGTRYLLRSGKQVNVLADGEPVNFLGFGEMPDEAADLVMTLIFLAAVALAGGKFKDQASLLDKAINELVDEYRVCEEYLRLCRL